MVVRRMSIQGENLSLRFGKNTFFEYGDFSIPDGSITGLFGRSGCGKSTLAKLLCGVYLPRSGTISMDEKTLSTPKGYDRKAGLSIQMVYQQPFAALDPSQKLGAGFRELIRYHHLAPDKKSGDALTERLLREAGLEPDILGHLPHQISGGEAQRISIARCLLFRPKLLILDEATSMLDVSTQANVLGLVRRLMAESGGSILLISHDEALVTHTCDRMYLLEGFHLKERIL